MRFFKDKSKIICCENCCENCYDVVDVTYFAHFKYWHDDNWHFYLTYKDKPISEITLNELEEYNYVKDNLYVDVYHNNICTNCLLEFSKNSIYKYYTINN